jgi:hypothetical protein
LRYSRPSPSSYSKFGLNIAEREQIDARRAIKVDEDEIFSILDLKDGQRESRDVVEVKIDAGVPCSQSLRTVKSNWKNIADNSLF